MKPANPLLKFILHFFLWLIPAFLLWWVSANSIILPALRFVVTEIASSWFYQEQVQVLDATGDRWYVRTNLLTKQQPEDINLHRRWTVFVQPILVFTIGFPILWAWLLATPSKRIFNQIVGNAIVFLIVAMALWLKVFYLIANIIVSGVTVQYMSRFEIILPIVNYYPAWILDIINHIQLFIAYLGCGLIVPIIWYAFNSHFIKKLIPKYKNRNQK